MKKNAAVLAEELLKRGFDIVSGGTDNHSMLVDLRTKYPDLTGKVAEKALVSADITVNKNMVPFDSRSAFQTSGIRLGTPAITTRGAKEDLMVEIAEMIETVLSNIGNEEVIANVRARVNETMKNYPLFALLSKRPRRQKRTTKGRSLQGSGLIRILPQQPRSQRGAFL